LWKLRENKTKQDYESKRGTKKEVERKGKKKREESYRIIEGVKMMKVCMYFACVEMS
jgi:hypothetical protein